MSIAVEWGKDLKGQELDELAVNTIRTLTIDAVQKANSGHPGLPMGCADFAYVLWTQFLKVDPTDPEWPDRDRFVLSAGHGSMLLYALLHLSGFDLSLAEIKNFRQWGSLTPGHPEFGLTPGVECTTGPLGQGIANAVGMAIAESWLAATFNTPAIPVVDHTIYALCGDGCMQEGVSSEAASLAGHLGLGKLILFYDSNNITIDGTADLAMSENVGARFESYGWAVQRIDGHNREEIARAIEKAQAETDRPSLIIGTTTIAFGSPGKAGSNSAHGAALGEEEVAKTKENLGWPTDAHFLVPEAARAAFAIVGERGGKAHTQWRERLKSMKRSDAEKGELWDQCYSGNVSPDVASAMPGFEAGTSIATRQSAGQALSALMETVPNLMGGSADLAGSNLTFNAEHGTYSREDRAGRNIHFGIREHAMGSILNGLCYHGGVRAFGATFLVFSDYMRPAIRLAAMSHLNPIYVFTHDSIYLGEDGPTHQPVEHVASLRAIPNLTVIRPADGTESVEAWIAAIENTSGPTALCLTRQGLENLDHSKRAPGAGVGRGAYVVAGRSGLTLIASGSEVSLAMQVHDLLAERSIDSRVVSMPSWELFDKQDEAYRNEILGESPRVAIEAGVVNGWERFMGDGGLFVGIARFGASAPGKKVAKELGLDAKRIVEERILPWIDARSSGDSRSS